MTEDRSSLSHTLELQISHSICTEISQAGDLRKTES